MNLAPNGSIRLRPDLGGLCRTRQHWRTTCLWYLRLEYPKTYGWWLMKVKKHTHIPGFFWWNGWKPYGEGWSTIYGCVFVSVYFQYSSWFNDRCFCFMHFLESDAFLPQIPTNSIQRQWNRIARIQRFLTFIDLPRKVLDDYNNMCYLKNNLVPYFGTSEGGGFKHVLFLPLLGEMIQFD